MRSVSHVGIIVRPPRHGWLPLRVELDDFVVDEAASAVLNDPMEELLDLLAFLVAPDPVGVRLCIWLEPDGYAFDLSGTTDPDRCVMRVFHDRTFVPPMQGRDMTLRFEGELETHQLRSTLHGALAGLLEGAGARALDTWRRDYSLQSYLDRFRTLQPRPPRRPHRRRSGLDE
jgi:hypothetical protein